MMALPPGITKNEALDILLSMEGCNKDGTGVGFVRNGDFVLRKSIRTASYLAKKNPAFLDHLPHPGWTIVHIRAASVSGIIANVNVHPFIAGNNCVCHNGTWHDHKIARLALSKQVTFHGWTDSETAAHLINTIGIKKFTAEINHAGVFLVLKRNGELYVIKTSGDLEMHRKPDGRILIASELEFPKYKSSYGVEGYYHFGADGKLINNWIKPSRFSSKSWNHYDKGEFSNIKPGPFGMVRNDHFNQLPHHYRDDYYIEE